MLNRVTASLVEKENFKIMKPEQSMSEIQYAMQMQSDCNFSGSLRKNVTVRWETNYIFSTTMLD